MINELNCTVNLNPGAGYFEHVHLSQYDTGRVLKFTVLDGSQLFDMSGYTVKLEGMRKDGLGYRIDGSIVDGKAVIAVDARMTKCAGAGSAKLAFYKGNEEARSATLDVYISQSIDKDASVDNIATAEQARSFDQRLSALENGSGGGSGNGDNANLWTNEVIDLFTLILRNARYETDMSANITALQNKLKEGGSSEETSVVIQQIGQALNLTLNSSTVNVEVN